VYGDFSWQIRKRSFDWLLIPIVSPVIDARSGMSLEILIKLSSKISDRFL
jgi:hypothetical protein